MLVQRVLMPASSLESWTVLGDDDLPVGPVERHLAYLTDIERSPNTVKAYAHDLKDWFTFLGLRGLDWREVRLEDAGEFVAWLRLPVAGRDGRVAVLPSVEHHVSAATVNRKLSAVSAFYQHAARHGVDLGELLVTWGPPGRRGGWKPFLHHISKSQPAPRRTIVLKASRRLPRVLSAGEVQAILDACGRLRDRLLFAVLYDTGMRIGEALGLRHEDIAAAEREITVVPRANVNGARCKSAASRVIPVSADLVRLYADYPPGPAAPDHRGRGRLQRLPHASGKTSCSAAQNPSAPSTMARIGARMPRRAQSRSRSAQDSRRTPAAGPGHR
jgi:integrase/recombinase XerD